MCAKRKAHYRWQEKKELKIRAETKMISLFFTDHA